MTDITAIVGPNESGKSNLFEALYRINFSMAEEAYNINEDWPVDNWGEKANSTNAVVCVAEFQINGPAEIEKLFTAAAKPHVAPEVAEEAHPEFRQPALAVDHHVQLFRLQTGPSGGVELGQV